MDCIGNYQLNRHCGLSPLRYPGGKAKISSFIRRVLEDNDLAGGHYAEPYAGGAGIAFSLLFHDYVKQVHLNDIDPAVYAFWRSVLDEPEKLCRLIKSTRVSISQWRRQRAIQNAPGGTVRWSLDFQLSFLTARTAPASLKAAESLAALNKKENGSLMPAITRRL